MYCSTIPKSTPKQHNPTVMKKELNNRLSMTKVVLRYIAQQNPQIINASPGLADTIAQITTFVNKAATLNQNQNINRKGHREYKLKLKNNLLDTAMEVTQALLAYANRTKNVVLFNEVKNSRTFLYKLRENNLTNRCSFLYKKAIEHQAHIETYGISSLKLEMFLNQINGFNSTIPNTRIAIVERVMLTKEIETEFKNLTQLLISLDISVNALSMLYPDFVSKYKTCRKIVNTQKTTLALSGKITNESGKPLSGAIITFSGTKKTIKSTLKGNFKIKILPKGIHNMQVFRPGYTTINQTIAIIKGETTNTNIIMSQNSKNLLVA